MGNKSPKNVSAAVHVRVSCWSADCDDVDHFYMEIWKTGVGEKLDTKGGPTNTNSPGLDGCRRSRHKATTWTKERLAGWLAGCLLAPYNEVSKKKLVWPVSRLHSTPWALLELEILPSLYLALSLSSLTSFWWRRRRRDLVPRRCAQRLFLFGRALHKRPSSS